MKTKRKIKFIAIDLDGTLLNSKGELSDESKCVLQEAIQSGMHVVIASGRPYGSLPEEVLTISGIDYAITSNGAAVYHVPTRKRIHGYFLDKEIVKLILKEVEDYPVVFETFVDGIAYADARYVDEPVHYGASERAVAYIQRTRNREEDIVGFIKKNIYQLDSIDIVVKDRILKEQIKMVLRGVEGIYVTSSVKQLIEISHRDAGKHSGLQFLGEILGVSFEEMAAIGNDDNDIDMLRYVGCGIAVANASEQCLEAADVIVGHHDEDGAAEAIRKLIKA